jgi:hypothetical protein
MKTLWENYAELNQPRKYAREEKHLTANKHEWTRMIAWANKCECAHTAFAAPKVFDVPPEEYVNRFEFLGIHEQGSVNKFHDVDKFVALWAIFYQRSGAQDVTRQHEEWPQKPAQAVTDVGRFQVMRFGLFNLRRLFAHVRRVAVAVVMGREIHR